MSDPKGRSVGFCIRGQMTREGTLLHLSGSDSFLLWVAVIPPHWEISQTGDVSGKGKETPVKETLSSVPHPCTPTTDGSLQMPKPITTAMNTVILKFISWVTAADERAIGVDTGLHAGVLSGTLVHIYGKQEHITDHSHNRTSPLTWQKMHWQQNLPGTRRPDSQVPMLSIQDLSSLQLRPQSVHRRTRASIHISLLAHKLGGVETTCTHISMWMRVHTYPSSPQSSISR